MSVSIVIPAYNEENRLGTGLELIKAYIDARGMEYEVILVDDGSSDKTALLAENFEGLDIKVLKNEKNMGKGYCVKKGMMEASKDILLFTDADMSTPIEFLDSFLKFHEEGFDVVAASRAIDRTMIKKKQPFLRDRMGRIFNFFVRSITGLRLMDTQCGFKSFKKDAAKFIFSRQTINGFGFDVEILYIANMHKYTIKEAPVNWFDSPGTKVNALRDSTKMFSDLIDIKAKRLKGRYS